LFERSVVAFYRDSFLGLAAWFLVSMVLASLFNLERQWELVSILLAFLIPWYIWVTYHHREFLRQSWKETRERQQRIERALGLENGPTVKQAWTDFWRELQRPIRALAGWLKLDAAETQRRRLETDALGQQPGKRGGVDWESLRRSMLAADLRLAQQTEKRDRETSGPDTNPAKEFRPASAANPAKRPPPAYLAEWRTPLMRQIQSLHPTAFEFLARDLLLAAGLSEVTVLGGSGDGGIDGIGQLRILRKAFPVYFQCKRY
jgi:hypothetical protein